jgi:tetratricopeptide (TPR) repeat protein
MRSIRLAAAAIALQLLMQAPAAAGPLELARQARVSGRLDQADRILDGALARQPNNYWLLYEKGLIEESRALAAPAGPQRTGHYRAALDWLARALRVGRAQRIRDYTLRTAIGTAYLGFGDLSRAQLHLEIGLSDEDEMDRESRGRLYANLGYLHAMRGDNSNARRYFEKGARLGNEQARQNLRMLVRVVP